MDSKTHRRRNLYWPQEVDEIAKELAWRKMLSVSQFTAELIIAEAKKKKDPEEASK